MTVSVVMPVYDGERYLAEAIDSILSQTFADFEFVIVDDGSRDTTPAILEKYASADSRIRVLSQAHEGVAQAANLGCRAARGEFVARMDADDVSLPTRLERQIRFLRAHAGVGIVGSDIEEFDDERTFERPARRRPLEPGVVRWSLMFGNCVAHATTTIRHALLERLGYYRIDVAEDYDLWIRAIEVTKIANLAPVLLRYRISPGQLTRRISEAQTSRGLELQQSLMASLLERDVPLRLVEILRESTPGDFQASETEIEAAGRLLRDLLGAYVRRFHPERDEESHIGLDARRRYDELRGARP